MSRDTQWEKSGYTGLHQNSKLLLWKTSENEKTRGMSSTFSLSHPYAAVLTPRISECGFLRQWHLYRGHPVKIRSLQWEAIQYGRCPHGRGSDGLRERCREREVDVGRLREELGGGGSTSFLLRPPALASDFRPPQRWEATPLWFQPPRLRHSATASMGNVHCRPQMG